MKLRFACCLWLLLVSGLSHSLQGQITMPDTTQLSEYKQQSRQLVRFLQFLMNTLGDPQTSRREKDIIINQSYLKIFDNPEVQIEDDLLVYRSTVTNKDVQAYLQDIDFFYKQARFDFTIEEVEHALLENGQLFFIVRLNRRLQGINVEGDSINTFQERFIEINLDQENRLLKIASIYTNALSEDEALATWWNELSLPWKEVFADQLMVNDSQNMGDILDLSLGARVGDTLLIAPDLPMGDSMRSSLSELFLDSEYSMDTLILNDPTIYRELKRLVQLEELELSSFPEIDDLSPLGRLSRLRKLNISGTKVRDLSSIRNLTRLEVLNCSYTPINSLAPLQYATSLRELIAHHTFLQNLDAFQHFKDLRILHLAYTPLLSIANLEGCPKLEELDLSYTRTRDLSPLAKANQLQNLKLTGSPIMDITPISSLAKLATLYIDHTGLAELGPLANLKALRLLFCEGTEIKDIQALLDLPALSKIYCDMTGIDQATANQFMIARPEVLVLYESAALQFWWQSLSSPWRTLLSQKMGWQSKPDREALHELANQTELDISSNQQISDLLPVQQLSQLRRLDCSNTIIEGLDPIKDLVELKYLNLNGTLISDLSALEALRNLRELDLSGTAVTSISALQGLRNLEILDVSNTIVKDLLFLKDLENLRYLKAESTEVRDPQAKQLLSFLPDLLLMYRGDALKLWWSTLDTAWQEVFRNASTLDTEPDSEQLHRLISLTTISANGSALKSLVPLQPFLRLETLTFSDTQISDLSPLRQHKDLQVLNCPRNPITDLTSVAVLINLKSLNIQNTSVSELGGLSQISSLEKINISGTQIKSLKSLEANSNLTRLDCSSTDINSLKSVQGLKKLTQLICFNTRLSERKVEAFKMLKPDCEVVHY